MSQQTASAPLRVGALVFPGFQSLDLFGPLDIFNTLSLKHKIELSVISTSLEPVSTQTQPGQVGQSIVPTVTLDNAPEELDLLIVPGGSGTKGDIDAYVAYVKRVYPRTGSVFSVCTGTRLFARAGILDGRRATTNKNAFYEVTPLGPKTHWVARARWVKDGNVWTAAGITAGIDATLAWVEERFGAQQATDAANWLEYNRTSDPSEDPFAAVRGIEDVSPTEKHFLNAAIDAEQDALDALGDLRRQDALLLLRTCLQHNLAHLLRTLDSEGLGDLWQRRDRQLRTALSAIRGGPPDSVRDLLCETEYDADLCALPVRLGGLGLLDHVERAPLARAAAIDAAKVVLADRFGDGDGDTPLSRGLSQRSRHAPVIAARLDALWARLDPDERVALLENASPLGRRWLTTIPWSRVLAISDEAVSAALFARALARPRTTAPGDLATPCTLCNAEQPTIGHMDTCSSRNVARTRIHETLKRVIARALEVGMPCSETSLEPQIGSSALRNDIRLAAAPGCPLPTTEYDVSTVALTTDTDHRPATRHAVVSDTRGDVLGRIDFALGFRARRKYEKQVRGGAVGHGAPHFVPLIISAGGVTFHATESGAMDEWRRHLPHWEYQNLLNAVSCALLTRRTYLLPRRLRGLGDNGGNGGL